MVIREHYLKQIRPFYDSDLIKIITGIRRCGKSVILEQVQDEIKAEGKPCLFLDFDLKPTRNMIPDADALIDYVDKYIKKEKLYVFLDEIQNVKEWNEACRTLRLKNCSVFISVSMRASCYRCLIAAYTRMVSAIQRCWHLSAQ